MGRTETRKVRSSKKKFVRNLWSEPSLSLVFVFLFGRLKKVDMTSVYVKYGGRTPWTAEAGTGWAQVRALEPAKTKSMEDKNRDERQKISCFFPGVLKTTQVGIPTQNHDMAGYPV